MSNLNEKFNDKAFIDKLREKDPDAFKNESFLLSGNCLKDNCQCAVDGCKFGAEAGKGREIASLVKDTGTKPRAPIYVWVFCYTCNRIFHLLCTGNNLEEFRLRRPSLPFRCQLCVGESTNQHAKLFLDSGNWKLPMSKRREFFSNPIDLTLGDVSILEQSSDGNEELEASYHDKFIQQRQEYENLAKLFGALAAEKSQSDETIKLQSSEITSLKEQTKEFMDMQKEMQKEVQILRSQLTNFNTRQELDAVKRPSNAQRSGVAIASSTVIGENLSVLKYEDVLSKFYLGDVSRVNERDSSVVSSGLGASLPGQSSLGYNAGAPLPSQNRSFVDGIDVNELTRAEKFTLEQVQAQKATAESQREISHNMLLDITRKALPKISTFDGDARKYVKFKQDVQRYRDVGQFPESVLKLHVMQALSGLALARVQDIMDTTSFDTILKLLEEGFGEPTKIIDRCSKDILSIKLSREIFKDDIMAVNTKIQGYFSACKYANVPYANSNHLANHIFDQLSLTYKQLFRHQFRLSNPTTPTKLIDLESLYIFLEDLAKDLEDKKLEEKKGDDKKSKIHAQVNVNSVFNANGSANKKPDDFIYEIKDKNVNPNGYDMQALEMFSKCCVCCMKSGHFVMQCRRYRSMDADQKLQFVIDKGLCRNCLVTSNHRATDCNLKNACGYRMGNDRCGRKHHISLHKSHNNYDFGRSKSNGRGGPGRSSNNRVFRRNNTNTNQNRANDILNSTQNSGTAPIPPQVTTNHVGSAINQAPTVSQLPNNRLNNNNNGHTVALNQTAFGGSNVNDMQANGSGYLPYRNLYQASGGSNANDMQQANGNGYLPYRNSHQASGSTANDMQQTNGIGYFPYRNSRQVMSISSSHIQRTVKVFKNKFLGKDGYEIGYSVGDSAAEVTLLRDDLRERLGLQGEKCSLMMQWTDGSLRNMEALRVNLVLQGVQPGAKEIVLKNCYSVPVLALPKRSLDVEKLKEEFPYLRKVRFDSYYDISPLLLIGSPHASAIESIGHLFEDGEGKPVGLRAKLGYSIYGGCPEEHSGVPYSVEYIVNGNEIVKPKEEKVTNEQLYDLLGYFSSIESLGIRNVNERFTEDEQKALDMIKEDMCVLPNGSIQLPLIWNRVNGQIPHIQNNFPMVYKRQLAQEAKLNKNPAHLKAFNDNFMELIKEGYVRPATYDDLCGEWINESYLPMSLVINANKDPPKYRNVFDASARYKGVSLNDLLLKGPDLLVSLVCPLLRMRSNKVAFTADIKSMFMRMKINLRDSQCQRILWRESMNDEMKVFIVTSMLFGPTCSPFSSQFVKNYVAEVWRTSYPRAAETIERWMYMDDILTSEENVNDAIMIAMQCIKIFESVNWELVSFQSNNTAFLNALPQANVKQGLISLLEGENEATTKVLGCQWDTKNDSFVFTFDKNLFVKIVKECHHHPTKRDQCSTVARIFDIFGLISHYTIRGKIMLQRSWLEGIGWDDPISEENYQNWSSWINDIEKIAKVKIDRKYNSVANLSKCDKVELHTFCDAGGEAFAAVSYMVTTVGTTRYSNIVMAKAKVTPIRHKSRTSISEMPRLELCAALIGTRLAHTITTNYKHINITRYFWTDSEVVLYWLLGANRKLLKYAIGPVEEILDKSTRSEWRYVPTKLNTADIATKFRKFDFGNSNSAWFKGPDFLRMNEKNWPAMPTLAEPPLVAEVATAKFVCIQQVLFMSVHKLPPVNCLVMSDGFVDRFSESTKSSWNKLVRATARAMKIMLDGVIPLLKTKQWRNLNVRMRIKEFHESFDYLSPNDIEKAEHFLIRKAQREVYAKEYNALFENREIDNMELKQLGVFLDSEGLIRINSRVAYEECDLRPQFAPLFPRRNAISRTYLEHIHYEFRHIHIESQIAAIRSKYWMPQIRAALKSIQSHCNFCSEMRARPYIPMMAPLPRFRTDVKQMPFDVTGLDCMGPFIVMNYTKTKKVWILIFVCTLTRFIHLHILDSLESVKVLEAIVLFRNCHGPPTTFISDRGTNFIGAANILEADKRATMNFLTEQHGVLRQHIAEKYKVDWKHLPAHSPWMGAFYERLIKEVKRSIAQAIDIRKLTMPILNIALQDAALRINNRPLTHNSVSADDEPILTPYLLAKGRSGWPSLPGLPEAPRSHIMLDRTIYHRGRAMADEIMRRFHRNYLPMLTKRTKWFKDEKPLEVGDLVLLIEPNDTRKEWRRGRVVKLYKGRDGRKRVADVILPDGSVKKYRSVQRLAKIEIKMIENAQ